MKNTLHANQPQPGHYKKTDPDDRHKRKLKAGRRFLKIKQFETWQSQSLSLSESK